MKLKNQIIYFPEENISNKDIECLKIKQLKKKLLQSNMSQEKIRVSFIISAI